MLVAYDSEHRRVFIIDRRTHHGAVGALIAALAHLWPGSHPRVLILGIALAFHDRRDFPWLPRKAHRALV